LSPAGEARGPGIGRANSITVSSSIRKLGTKKETGEETKREGGGKREKREGRKERGEERRGRRREERHTHDSDRSPSKNGLVSRKVKRMKFPRGNNFRGRENGGGFFSKLPMRARAPPENATSV
jgi:hypothetical protein